MGCRVVLQMVLIRKSLRIHRLFFYSVSNDVKVPYFCVKVISHFFTAREFVSSPFCSIERKIQNEPDLMRQRRQFISYKAA